MKDVLHVVWVERRLAYKKAFEKAEPMGGHAPYTSLAAARQAVKDLKAIYPYHKWYVETYDRRRRG